MLAISKAYWRSRERTRVYKMISVDDYTEDNYYIADIAKKYNMQDQFIFFLDTLKAGEMAKTLFDDGFIIGSHTVNHRSLSEIPEKEAKYELKESFDSIKRWTGKDCEWLSYPFGQYNEKVIEMVKETGYKYARTTHLLNFNSPYEVSAMHIGRISGDEWGGQDSFEMAKRTRLNHFYLHYYDLLRGDTFKEFEEYVKAVADKR